MKNFNLRFITSITMLLVIYFAFTNSLALISVLFLISFISLIETKNILNKLFLNKINNFFLFILSVLYFGFFSIQIFLFMNNTDNNSPIVLIFLLAICISTDIGGYFFGKLFKGKKLTKISPNKTYSGLIGSYFFSIIVFIFFYNFYEFNLNFLILTILLSTISQLGDLFFSYLKRSAKIKDTGNILPGHGGLLDRIDGIIFSIPIGINIYIFF
tara:strand:- start:225 stop:866 length:642 start_codon:yes stop_codon:yes gene_type:complete